MHADLHIGREMRPNTNAIRLSPFMHSRAATIKIDAGAVE